MSSDRPHSLNELRAPLGIEGKIEAIVVRDRARAPARRIDATNAIVGVGLADDRFGQQGEPELSTRQVTLLQFEHLPIIAKLARVEAIDPIQLRRNLVISGINLVALRNAQLQVGVAVLELVSPCHPCSIMEETIGRGGYAAMCGHGGMNARVVVGGPIRLGDGVRVLAVS